MCLETFHIIKSFTKEIDFILENFTNIARKYNYTDEIITYKVPLVIDELLRNAIIHGNSGDVKKNVFIRQFYTKNTYKLEIKDEGNGFNFEKYLKNSYSAEKGETGRGLLLVKNIVDEIIFKNNGEIVVVSIKMKGGNC